MYKKELINIGYSKDDIKLISNKISDTDIKKYLLSKKYNNISTFISSPYFKIENINRYEMYYTNKANYSIDQIVLYVNIGLDNEFYTNIKEIKDYTSITTLVNKYNKLPDNVNYDDLVTIEKPYSNDGTKKIRKIVYNNLIQMIEDAKKDNINLFVISGFRTHQRQNELFNNSLKKNGLNHALIYSAKSGHSEHELGLAVDLVSVLNDFEYTKEYKWLKQNSYKYGFIERYPKNKEFITGFAYEPWHYRYLGVEISTKIFKENITFEEYHAKYL